jgi:hypothetical protein
MFFHGSPFRFIDAGSYDGRRLRYHGYNRRDFMHRRFRLFHDVLRRGLGTEFPPSNFEGFQES